MKGYVELVKTLIDKGKSEFFLWRNSP